MYGGLHAWSVVKRRHTGADRREDHSVSRPERRSLSQQAGCPEDGKAEQ